jgi:competence protein ComEA
MRNPRERAANMAERVLAYPHTCYARLLARSAARPDAASESRFRWRPRWQAALAMACVGALAWVLADRPHRLITAADLPSPGVATAVRTTPATARTSTGVGPPAATPDGTGTTLPDRAASRIVVDVVGKVRHQGVYRLPSESRVEDAVLAAGGAAAGLDLSTVNLARRLVDGEQVAIGVSGASALWGGAADDSGGIPQSGLGAVGSPPGRPLQLNQASASQFDGLPGVGPVLAEHIVEWRSAHGGFSSVSQLNDVPGIGDTKFASLKPLVTLS